MQCIIGKVQIYTALFGNTAILYVEEQLHVALFGILPRLGHHFSKSHHQEQTSSLEVAGLPTLYVHYKNSSYIKRGHAGVQPRLIQGIRSGDGVGEDQDTIASNRY